MNPSRCTPQIVTLIAFLAIRSNALADDSTIDRFGFDQHGFTRQDYEQAERFEASAPGYDPTTNPVSLDEWLSGSSLVAVGTVNGKSDCCDGRSGYDRVIQELTVTIDQVLRGQEGSAVVTFEIPITGVGLWQRPRIGLSPSLFASGKVYIVQAVSKNGSLVLPSDQSLIAWTEDRENRILQHLADEADR